MNGGLCTSVKQLYNKFFPSLEASEGIVGVQLNVSVVVYSVPLEPACSALDFCSLAMDDLGEPNNTELQ